MSDQQTTEVYCPHCLKPVVHWGPDIPVFPLSAVAVFLCMPSVAALHTALWRHKKILGPPRYVLDSRGRRHRVLTAEEVRALRAVKRYSVWGLKHVWRALQVAVEARESCKG
jgi:hypothetical protein